MKNALDPQLSANIDETNLKVIDDIEPGSFRDRAFGSILGAFTADACGSFHEFVEEVVGEEGMDKCMEMTGGGPHNNGPG